jgi:hypothetical protein
MTIREFVTELNRGPSRPRFEVLVSEGDYADLMQGLERVARVALSPDLSVMHVIVQRRTTVEVLRRIERTGVVVK